MTDPDLLRMLTPNDVRLQVDEIVSFLRATRKTGQWRLLLHLIDAMLAGRFRRKTAAYHPGPDIARAHYPISSDDQTAGRARDGLNRSLEDFYSVSTDCAFRIRISQFFEPQFFLPDGEEIEVRVLAPGGPDKPIDRITRKDLFALLPAAFRLYYDPRPRTLLSDSVHHASRLTIVDPNNVVELCDRFVNAAPGAELLFYYSVFFEPYMHKHRHDAVSEIKKIQLALESRYSTAIHRVQALPAAAAAHLLGCTVAEKDVEYLNGVIVEAFQSEKREVPQRRS